MKSPLQVEAWALALARRVERREPAEDFLIEAKSEWPPPERAARQIAGHANAASPEEILWVIGADERSALITGAAPQEFSNWWAAVSAQFEGIPPSVAHYVIPYQAVTLIAIEFETDRAPYVTRNPVFGKSGGGSGPVEFEPLERREWH